MGNDFLHGVSESKEETFDDRPPLGILVILSLLAKVKLYGRFS